MWDGATTPHSSNPAWVVSPFSTGTGLLRKQLAAREQQDLRSGRYLSSQWSQSGNRTKAATESTANKKFYQIYPLIQAYPFNRNLKVLIPHSSVWVVSLLFTGTRISTKTGFFTGSSLLLESNKILSPANTCSASVLVQSWSRNRKPDSRS